MLRQQCFLWKLQALVHISGALTYDTDELSSCSAVKEYCNFNTVDKSFNKGSAMLFYIRLLPIPLRRANLIFCQSWTTKDSLVQMSLTYIIKESNRWKVSARSGSAFGSIRFLQMTKKEWGLKNEINYIS